MSQCQGSVALSAAQRETLAFKTGDRAMLLYDVLENHQTKDYATARALLEEMVNAPEVKAVEDWEKMTPVREHYKYPAAVWKANGERRSEANASDRLWHYSTRKDELGLDNPVPAAGPRR